MTSVRTKNRGFSLAELAMMMVIFSIFSTSLIASLNLSLRYWRQTSNRSIAQQNARIAIQTITTELRQAAHPSTVQSAFVIPSSNTSPNNQSTGTLEFTETCPYDSSGNPIELLGQTNLDAPNLFQTVTYQVVNNATLTPSSPNNTLLRTVQTYNSDGSINTTTSAIVVQCTDLTTGSIQLNVTRNFTNAASVEVQMTEQGYWYALTCNQVCILYH